MNSFFRKWSWLFLVVSLSSVFTGCGSYDEGGERSEQIGTISQAVISVSDANDLINDGRAQIGNNGGQCKDWARNNTQTSYGPTIPATLADNIGWDMSGTPPVTQMAQWRGSYANGRTGPHTLGNGLGITPVTVSIPNSDPQIIVLYASAGNVTATLTKGATVRSVTSPAVSPMSGAISTPATVFGSGNATLTVQNNSGGSANNIVAVVLSRSRFVSDWETARRGDIMQMFLGPYSSNRATTSPHTTFVQTDYNSTSGTCSGGTTTGCNWLDSNWVATNIVGAHNMVMDGMIRATAFSSSYGFTVYRLN